MTDEAVPPVPQGKNRAAKATLLLLALSGSVRGISGSETVPIGPGPGRGGGGRGGRGTGGRGGRGTGGRGGGGRGGGGAFVR